VEQVTMGDILQGVDQASRVGLFLVDIYGVGSIKHYRYLAQIPMAGNMVD
jgi:hypothetical protein